MQLRRDQKALLWAGASTLPFWIAPILQPLLLPLILLNTHVHELCHALAALATGGSVSSIQVHADTSGVTHVAGGAAVVVAAAGYVGTSIVGGIMIAGARSHKGARQMLWVLFGFLAFALLLFVRGDAIGLLSGFAWAIAIALCARRLKDDAAIFAAQFLGIQLCLSSFFSFLTLLNMSWHDGGHSDAKIMESVSGIPAVFWASCWMLISAIAIGFAIRASWQARGK